MRRLQVVTLCAVAAALLTAAILAAIPDSFQPAGQPHHGHVGLILARHASPGEGGVPPRKYRQGPFPVQRTWKPEPNRLASTAPSPSPAGPRS
jgi:hypothetical protein